MLVSIRLTLVGKAHAVNGRQLRRDAFPRVPLVLGNPQPAGGRAEGQALPRGIDREAVAVDEVVRVLLGEAFSQHLKRFSRLARTSHDELAVRPDPGLAL